MCKLNDFKEKAKSVHFGFYSYDKVNYINAKEKVIITCPIHNDFEQIPYNHLMGKGCLKCGIEKLKNIFRKSQSNFINDCRKIHSDKYDYSLVEYINDSTEIKILCRIHGEFSQRANKHLRGHGCPHCKHIKTKHTNQIKHSTLFPIKARKIHNGFYDYSNVDYIDAKTPVNIICPKHGSFSQIPSNHLNGKGCSKCSQSVGERKIEIFLLEQKIEFESQKKFDDCIRKSKLSFDFYLPSKNLIIEFDGLQHYKPLGFMGGYQKLKYTKECDKIKDEYCKKNNIRLLRISYKEVNRIDEILKKF